MKTLILAATAVFGLSVGHAYANGEGDSTGETFFTQLPGEQPLAPGQPPNAAALARENAAANSYMASHNSAGWVVPPSIAHGS